MDLHSPPALYICTSCPVQTRHWLTRVAALKGAGATVRYVTLPNAPHGYRGRESTLHVLWEMNDWLDRYLKHAPAKAAAAKGS